MLLYSIITSAGSCEVNEDSVGAYENNGRYGFIVCDGLGGHGMGDIASQSVKEVFQDCFSKADGLSGFLGQTFIMCQQELLKRQKEMRAEKKMKTTAAALVIDEKTAFMGHVGDSRIYVFDKNKVKCRTLDHSVSQMLVISKQLKEKEIRNHPDRNLLLRVMGIEWEEPMYELAEPIDLKKCQAFLLCTDGFWELIEEHEMCSLLKKAESPESWLKEMEKKVLANGADRKMDNYSAVAVWRIKP